MKYLGKIDVMPLEALLDPQGKAVNQSMHNIGFESVVDVRIGKHIEVTIEAENKMQAEKLINEACGKILTNPIMEGYEFVVDEA